MASFLYKNALSEFAKGNIDWEADDIRVICVDGADYTASDTHTVLTDIPSGARVATSGNLANKAVSSGGICDADDIVINSVSGDQFEALVLYKHTGTESTSTLIAYIDSYSGLAFTPSGANITVRWPNTTNRIFKL